MNRHNFVARSPQSPGGSEEEIKVSRSGSEEKIKVGRSGSEGALIAQTHWETKWLGADSAFDPAYERTNAALRRWVDGMEQALIATMSRRTAALRAAR